MADRHLADHRAVLRRAQPQQQDRPGVVLLARAHRASTRACRCSRSVARPDRWPSYQARAGARPLRGIVDLKAIPVGYGVAIIGLCILGIAGPWDLIWHSVYGFEVNVEAIFSPPHLALFFGGLLVSSTGIRSMWAKRDLAPDFRALPAGAASRRSLFTAMLGFITMYLSAWMTNVPPTTAFVNDFKSNFHDVVTDQHIGLNAGLRGYGDNLFPYHYYTVGLDPRGARSSSRRSCCSARPCCMLRRWRVPARAFTLIYLRFGLLT